MRVLVVAMALSMVPAGQSQTREGQADVEMSVTVEKTSLVLFEPVFVDLSFRNLLNDPIRYNVNRFDEELNSPGGPLKEWLSFSVTAPDGETRHIPRSRPREGLADFGSVTLSPLGFVTLSPQGVWTERLLLNEWYAFDSPGVYRVQIDFEWTFESMAGEPMRRPEPGSVEIRIGERDEARLREISEELAMEALSNSDRMQAVSAAETLSHVRDPVAVQYLARLSTSGDFRVKEEAVVGLGRIGTEEAVDVLLGQLSAANGTFIIYVRDALEAAAANTSDSALRSRIQEGLRSGPVYEFR